MFVAIRLKLRFLSPLTLTIQYEIGKSIFYECQVLDFTPTQTLHPKINIHIDAIEIAIRISCEKCLGHQLQSTIND